MSKLIRSMHVIAARRGDGLLPELAALLERHGPHSDVGAYSKVPTPSCANTTSRMQKPLACTQSRIVNKIGSRN